MDQLDKTIKEWHSLTLITTIGIFIITLLTHLTGYLADELFRTKLGFIFGIMFCLPFGATLGLMIAKKQLEKVK